MYPRFSRKLVILVAYPRGLSIGDVSIHNTSKIISFQSIEFNISNSAPYLSYDIC